MSEFAQLADMLLLRNEVNALKERVNELEAENGVIMRETSVLYQAINHVWNVCQGVAPSLGWTQITNCLTYKDVRKIK